MIARTLVRIVAVTCATWLVTFALFSSLPGDAARAMAGPQAPHADVEHLRRTLHLDEPWPTRVLAYGQRSVHSASSARSHRSCTTVGALHVDLGFSFVYRRPVTKLLSARLPPSLALAIVVAGSAVFAGLSLGFLARSRQRARGLVYASRLVSAVPAFALGLLVQEVAARRLGWFPLEASLETWSSTLRSAVLPWLTLTAAIMGPYVAVAHAHWADLEGSAFVRASVARGASPGYALWHHGIRQVCARLTALACLDAGALVGGAVLTERLFRWPGLGSLAVEGMLARDLAVISAVVVVAALGVTLANACGDLVMRALDPRLREEPRST